LDGFELRSNCMIPTPTLLTIGMARTSKRATLLLEFAGANNDVLVEARTIGIQGNQISISFEFIATGAASCAENNRNIIFYLPSELTFEASGTFFYNGVQPTDFNTLWYAGIFNGKISYSLDGLPVSYPLTRDGVFFLNSAGAWHMIKRQSGINIMHWSSLSTASELSEIPVESWVGIAPLCTGTVDVHTGADFTTVDYLSFIVEGIPEAPGLIVVNENAKKLITIGPPPGQLGFGKVLPVTAKFLDGGK